MRNKALTHRPSVILTQPDTRASARAILDEMGPVLPAKVRGQAERIIERLSDSNIDVRRQAAVKLLALAVQHRGELRPRGTRDVPAPSLLGQSAQYRTLLNAASDADEIVRQNVIVALGEWGDEQAARLISTHLGEPNNEPLHEACIVALKLIGGSFAVSRLVGIAQEATVLSTRLVALSALEELAAGGWDDYSDRPSSPLGNARPNLETTTPVLKRLESMSQDLSLPRYLRYKADRVLVLLTAHR